MTTIDFAMNEPINLTNCDREPIHIPGLVQPHGVLLVLAEPRLTISQVSANAERILGRPAASLLGQPVSRLLPAEQVDYLRGAREREPIDANPLYLFTVLMSDDAQLLDGIVHRMDGNLILELEPAQPHATTASADTYALLKTAVARMQPARGVRDFCQIAARQVRELTGFDRVMVYQSSEAPPQTDEACTPSPNA